MHWIIKNQAEIAVSLGRSDLAEQHFKKGLLDHPDDAYLLRGYADLLLDQDQADEALQLVRDHLADNGLLLRAAIAARRIGDEQAAEAWRRQLAERFAEIRLRGGEPHGRYEARYYLELQDDPDRALVIALANWQKQKERRDARNLLEAAVAAHDAQAAQPAVDFLKQHGVEDITLARLTAELEFD